MNKILKAMDNFSKYDIVGFIFMGLIHIVIGIAILIQ